MIESCQVAKYFYCQCFLREINICIKMEREYRLDRSGEIVSHNYSDAYVDILLNKECNKSNIIDQMKYGLSYQNSYQRGSSGLLGQGPGPGN